MSDTIRDGLTDEITILKSLAEGLNEIIKGYSTKKLSMLLLLPKEYPDTKDTSDIHIQISDLRAESENKFASGSYIKTVDYTLLVDIKVRKTKNPRVHALELVKRIRSLMEDLRVSQNFRILKDMKVSLGLDGDMDVTRLRYIINYDTTFDDIDN